MRMVALPREEHMNHLSSTKQTVLKTYKQLALYEVNKLYLGIYTCKHIYICMQHQLVKKGGHEFEGE